MQINRQTEYAIRTILELSKLPYGSMLNAKTISENQNIPEVFLKKTIQMLSRGGLVLTQRGTQGGVKLARPSCEITIADVVVTIEGPLALNLCINESYHCKNKPQCQVHRILRRTQDAVVRELTRETFADILEGHIFNGSDF